MLEVTQKIRPIANPVAEQIKVEGFYSIALQKQFVNVGQIFLEGIRYYHRRRRRR